MLTVLNNQIFHLHCNICIHSNIEAQPIWLQEVNCRSSVWSCLSVCQMCPPLFDSSGEVFTCNHTQDVTVQCGIQGIP